MFSVFKKVFCIINHICFSNLMPVGDSNKPALQCPTHSSAQKEAEKVFYRAGFSAKGIARIVKRYGAAKVLGVILENPYRLSNDGLCSFSQSDQLGRVVGLAPDSQERLDGIFQHYLKKPKIDLFEFHILNHSSRLKETLDLPEDTILDYWYRNSSVYFYKAFDAEASHRRKSLNREIVQFPSKSTNNCLDVACA